MICCRTELMRQLKPNIMKMVLSEICNLSLAVIEQHFKKKSFFNPVLWALGFLFLIGLPKIKNERFLNWRFAVMRISFTLFANRFSRIFLSLAALLRRHLPRQKPDIRSAYWQLLWREIDVRLLGASQNLFHFAPFR